MRADGHDRAVQRVDELGRSRRGTRSDLPDRRQAVFLVPRIDALRAVPHVEILVEAQAGDLLEDRHADFLGTPRVHRGLIHDYVAFLEHLADRVTRFFQRRQVRPLVVVDRCGHRDDEDPAGPQILQVGRVGELRGRGQFFRPHLERAVPAVAQFRDPMLVDVEPDRLEALTELDRKRQADIAEADHADFEVT